MNITKLFIMMLMFGFVTISARADFTIESNAKEVAVARIKVPNVLNNGTNYEFQLMIPMPTGKFDEYSAGLTWLGFKDPNDPSQAIPLQLKKMQRDPIGQSRSVQAVGSFQVSSLANSSFDLKLYEGSFDSAADKSDAIAPFAPPNISNYLLNDKIYYVAKDAYGHAYVANLFNQDTPRENNKTHILGHNRIEISTYQVLQPIIPVNSTSRPALPRFQGLYSHFELSKNNYVKLSLMTDVSSPNLNGQDNEKPSGPLFFESIRFFIPVQIFATPGVDRKYQNFNPGDCRYPARLTLSPEQGGSTVTVPTHYECDLIAKRNDNKLHYLNFGSTHSYQFVISEVTNDPNGQVSTAIAEMGDQAFVRRGVNSAGEKYWSWWNYNTPWLHPVGKPIPHHDFLQGNEAASMNYLQNWYAAETAMLQNDFKNGTNNHGLLEENHPDDPHPKAYYKGPGATSGRYIDGSSQHAIKVAYAASQEGLKFIMMNMQAWQNRVRYANYKSNGVPAAAYDYIDAENSMQGPGRIGPQLTWLDCDNGSIPPSYISLCYQIRPFSGNNGGVLVLDPAQASPLGYIRRDKFGFYDHMDQTQALYAITNNLYADYALTAASFEHLYASHRIRHYGNVISLAYLKGDPLAIRELRMAAAAAQHETSEFKESSSYFGDGTLAKILDSTNPDTGPEYKSGTTFGREYAWSTYVVAADYPFAPTNWRDQVINFARETTKLYQQAQIDCTGGLYAKLNDGKFINGQAMWNQDLWGHQFFEVEYGTYSQEAYMHNIFANTGEISEARLETFMDNYYSKVWGGDHAWSEGDYNGSPKWGYYKFLAVRDNSGEPFCHKPPYGTNTYPTDPSAMPMDYVTAPWSNPGPAFYLGTSSNNLESFYSANPLSFAAYHNVGNASLFNKLICRLQKMKGSGNFNTMLNNLTYANFDNESQYNLSNDAFALRLVQDLQASGFDNFCN